jgi:hypothetical protein
MNPLEFRLSRSVELQYSRELFRRRSLLHHKRVSFRFPAVCGAAQLTNTSSDRVKHRGEHSSSLGNTRRGMLVRDHPLVVNPAEANGRAPPHVELSSV